MICIGEGRYRVILQYLHLGSDTLVTITGGEEEHIGAATKLFRTDVDRSGLQSLDEWVRLLHGLPISLISIMVITSDCQSGNRSSILL